MAHPITETGNEFNYNLLNEELAIGKEEKLFFDIYLKALKGDFWQVSGTSTLLPPSDAKSASIIPALFEPRYISRNIISEGVARVSSAFLGRSPNWSYVVDGKRIDLRTLTNKKKDIEKNLSLKKRRDQALLQNQAQGNPDNPPPEPEPANPPPTDDELTSMQAQLSGIEKELKETEFLQIVDKLLGEYWTFEGVAEVMIKAFETRLTASRGGIRIHVPKKYKSKENSNFVETLDFDKSLKAIEIEFISPTEAKLLKDDGEIFSIIRYEVRKDWTTKDKVKIIEYSFIDEQGLTFIGICEENDDKNGIPTEAGKDMSEGLFLDENTTYNEFAGDPYITEQVFRNNQGVNLALTCGGFNIVDAGFRHIITTNVDVEYDEVASPDSENGFVKVPKKVKMGGGVINNFTGLSRVNLETAQEEIMQPGVHIIDPASMETFQAGKDMYYEACLEELGQKYALISGDATTSGEARIQALVDFYLKVRKYKAEVDRVGSWLLTVILRFAATLSGDIEKFKNVSILFDSKIKVGNLTSSEKEIVLKMREGGIISYETARVLLEIDDPGIEEELIQREREVEALTNPVPPTPPIQGNQSPSPQPIANSAGAGAS